MEHNNPDGRESGESAKQCAGVHPFTDEVGDGELVLICLVRLVHEARQT